ncbi:CLUMA_CG005211, isoform A [Clunio marinus]|uniref:CLUMA_CG005211, isoform A n=1 Tax=Clunio marinus TaxID=568069 RepID=A0A1J1HVH3_9DIPT|nr:CLUMA_CG005211, isoform A [Clunio marinus]
MKSFKILNAISNKTVLQYLKRKFDINVYLIQQLFQLLQHQFVFPIQLRLLENFYLAKSCSEVRKVSTRSTEMNETKAQRLQDETRIT